MSGQGITPKACHPIFDAMPEEELKDFPDTIKMGATRLSGELPSHKDFIDNFCKAKMG